jgi:uncharacterized protein (TIGR03435 family)
VAGAGIVVGMVFCSRLVVKACGVLLVAAFVVPGVMVAQATDTALSFDVASVRENKTVGTAKGGDRPSANVPMGPGNVYSPTGGRFTVKKYTLLSYISFAYRMTDAQLTAFQDKAPEWVVQDRFDVDARTDKADVTKDELRLMVRSLLAERFHMVVHYETRSASVYGLTLVKAGVLGPRLREHPEGEDCPTTMPEKVKRGEPEPSETTGDGYPSVCGGLLMLPSSTESRYVLGARGVSLALLVNALPGWGGLTRPVVDRTGLQGRYDFTMTFAPLRPMDAPAADDSDAPSFQEALQQQLGLKLESQEGDVQVLVLDHIDHLVEN